MEGEKASKLFSLKEVEEHNSSNKSEKSVWLVIHDQVFDVTKFLDEVYYSLSIYLVNIEIV